MLINLKWLSMHAIAERSYSVLHKHHFLSDFVSFTLLPLPFFKSLILKLCEQLLTLGYKRKTSNSRKFTEITASYVHFFYKVYITRQSKKHLREKLQILCR